MKHKLKVLATAVVLAIGAGQANAAIDLASTGNGELFFTAWDSVANVSYSRQLEVNLNSFLPNSLGGDKTPESSLSLSFAGDTLFTSTFGASDVNNIHWNLVTADSTVSGSANTPGSVRILTTSTAASAAGITLTNTGLATAVQKVNTFQGSVNAMGCLSSSSCSTSSPADAGFGGSAANWGDSFGSVGAAHTSGTGFGSLFFYYITGGGGTGLTNAAKTLFANSFGAATWSLASDGSLLYSLAAPAAVPLPAAIWLFGSGLMGIATIARRRRSIV